MTLEVYYHYDEATLVDDTSRHFATLSAPDSTLVLNLDIAPHHDPVRLQIFRFTFRLAIGLWSSFDSFPNLEVMSDALNLNG